MKKSNVFPDYNLSRNLPKPRYKIIYHLNNDDINLLEHFFVEDNNVYNPGETIVIQGYNTEHPSQDGLYYYKFEGWARAAGLKDNITYTAGRQLSMGNSHLNLYAQWSKKPTLIVDADGGVMLNQEYSNSITHIMIPEYYNNSVRIKTIRENAFLNSSVMSITIPPSITKIESNAFFGWAGNQINFIDNQVTNKYPALTLEVNCFAEAPNLLNITLPYRWHNSSGVLFNKIPNNIIEIKIRNTKAFMMEKLDKTNALIESYIAPNNDPAQNFSRVFRWGYND